MVEAVAEGLCDYDLPDTYYECIQDIVGDHQISQKLFQQLNQLGLVHFEKRLGQGAAGSVFQIAGGKKFSHQKVALKVLSPSEMNLIKGGNHGEVISIKLPENSYLGQAYGIFTYDGIHVHYAEKFDPIFHRGHVLIATISEAVQGETLFDHMQHRSMSIEEVKGYGRKLAQAILSLHESGFVHQDLHAKNILVKDFGIEKDPCDLKVIDFTLSSKIWEGGVRDDWKNFGILISEMGENLILNSHFYDLVYSEMHGLLNGLQPYSENEILNHSFFS